MDSEVAANREERNHRLAEEACELLQACGYKFSELIAMAFWVYTKDPGSPEEEMGDVMSSLTALATAHGVDLNHACDMTLARNWKNIDKIREKHRNKALKSAARIQVPANG